MKRWPVQSASRVFVVAFAMTAVSLGLLAAELGMASFAGPMIPRAVFHATIAPAALGVTTTVIMLVVLSSLPDSHRTARSICPRCGYDLRGDLDAGCPECGWNREERET